MTVPRRLCQALRSLCGRRNGFGAPGIWSVLIFAGVFAGRSFAIDGVVWTLDGRRLEGDVRPGSNVLVVARGAAGEMNVPLGEIYRAQFSTNVIAAQTHGSGNGLLGIYFANSNFSSNTVMRLDQGVDFDWRDRAPILGIPKNGFSVRWMGEIEAPTTDRYTIFFGTDGGGRIYFDDKLLADNVPVPRLAETNVVLDLKAGERHRLMLEYIDAQGAGRAQLKWSTPAMGKVTVPPDRLYAASFDTNHVADASALAGTQGLLATYYNSTNFTGNSFSRIDPEIDFAWKGRPPAPGLPTNNFSVRWLGNLLITNSGQYQFQVMSGLPLRLYLNDKLISNPWMVALIHTSEAGLNRSERNELRLEIRATNNVVPIKLWWKGPGFEKTLLTREHLTPAIGPSHEPPGGSWPVLPAGIVLTSGAIIDAPIQSANNSSIRLRGMLATQPIALTRVARIHVKPLTTELALALPKGRAGVLLKNRDFIDGEFAGIENGRVTIESVLFGKRTFELTKDVFAIVLRGTAPSPWRYSITARDGTVLYGKDLRCAPGQLTLAELPDIRVGPGQLAEVARREDRSSR